MTDCGRSTARDRWEKIPGEATAIEIERKFLLAAEPDWSHPLLVDAQVAELEQVYLVVGGGREVRLRRWSDVTGTRFLHTTLVALRPGIREVTEIEISEGEYAALLRGRDKRRSIVRKRRLSFPYDDLVFELDVIVEPAGRACLILEVQVDAEGYPVSLPNFLLVDREVTGDPRYSNADISRG